MSPRNWFARWRHRRRWRRAERNQQGPLREFVYLDDVSVYSLVASQVGLIVTELTETQASSLQTEVNSAVGVSGPFKAEAGSKLQAGESQSSQVLRKAIVQTTFKQLHETATRSGALRFQASTEPPPTIRSLEDVKELARREPSPFVIDPRRLRRGDLIELEVRLEPEPIFQAGAVMSGLLEIIQDDPAAFGVHDFGELAQVRLVSRMLDKVLAGLVPLRGRATQYEAVEIEGDEWLLHSGILAQLSQAPAPVPVFLVGVAQQALFWKDVRRVLFSGSSYHVLARLSRPGLQRSWTPVKLVDVLRTVIPDFAEVMETMNRGVLSAMSSAVAAHQATPPTQRVRAAAVAYASMLGERMGVEISEHDLETGRVFDHDLVDGQLGVREWRALFAPVTQMVEDRAGQAIDRQVAADYRVAAITQAGLLEPAAAPAPTFDVVGGEHNERFLDTEIVAVYW